MTISTETNRVHRTCAKNVRYTEVKSVVINTCRDIDEYRFCVAISCELSEVIAVHTLETSLNLWMNATQQREDSIVIVLGQNWEIDKPRKKRSRGDDSNSSLRTPVLI